MRRSGRPPGPARDQPESRYPHPWWSALRPRSGGVGIPAEVELLPGPARLGAMLFDQPLAGATQRQARAVHQQVHGLAVPVQSWPGHLQRLGPAAQGRMVGRSEIEQTDDGADQAFGLAQRQPEYSAEG